MKYNIKFISSITLAMVQVLRSHMWLITTILDSADMELIEISIKHFMWPQKPHVVSKYDIGECKYRTHRNEGEFCFYRILSR